MIYVLTHDSIGLGEDGPTHQPIEHLAALRAIPNLTVIRPADANETAVAWRVALTHRHGPVLWSSPGKTCQFWTAPRWQPLMAWSGAPISWWMPRGKSGNYPDRHWFRGATGVGRPSATRAQGYPGRVVSMPSWELFDQQPQSYRDAVLPPTVRKRLAIEAGVPQGWHYYVGAEGDVIGLRASGPRRLGRW